MAIANGIILFMVPNIQISPSVSWRYVPRAPNGARGTVTQRSYLVVAPLTAAGASQYLETHLMKFGHAGACVWPDVCW